MAQGIRYQSPKYQEAYIPDQLIPLMDQVGGYHQQRYDATEGQISNMYKDLYDRQIYDPNAFQQEMGNIQSKVEDINKQYKGDLSAGMSDYIRLIGKAKQSPFWKTNDIANKKLEQQSELLARYGKSALAFSKLPTSLTTKDPETGQQRYLRPDEINFDIDKMSDWDARMDKVWQDSLHEEATKAKLPKEMIGETPFIEIAKGRGITNNQVLRKAAFALEGYKNTDEYAQQKKALMAGLAPDHQGIKLDSNDAEKIIADDILSTGKRKKYWSDDSQIIHDSNYGKDKNPSNGQVPYSGTFIVNPSQSVEDIQDKFKKIREVSSGKNINSKPGTGLSTRAYTWGVPDLGRPKSFGLDATQQANKDLEDLKKNYSMVWDASGQDSNKFLNAIESIETDRAKSKYLIMDHPDTEAQNIFTKSINEKVSTGLGSKFVKLDENLNPDSDKKGNDIFKSKDHITTSRTDLYHGRIILYNGKGETYEMNPNLLNEDTEHYLNIAKDVLNKHFDYNDDAFKPVVDNKQIFNISGNAGYLAYSKGQDGLIHKIFVDEKGEPYTSGGKIIESPNFPPQNEEAFRYELMDKVYGSANPFLRKAIGKTKNQSISEPTVTQEE